MSVVVVDPDTFVHVSSVFPLSQPDQFAILHAVRGVEFVGLLIDPGASKGLIGMDTVKDLSLIHI